ncbi:MAG: LmeA family phospholipid-binding protein, partial [Cyanobacteria bacterium J06628_3]
MLKKNQFKLVTNILAEAIKLWLRTQVSHIEQLQLDIQARNRQILSGYIPSVSIVAEKAVYQGLHLSKIDLV